MLTSWLSGARDIVDHALRGIGNDAWPAPFAEAIVYPLFTGGKRFRPALTLAAAECLGHRDAPGVLEAAVAVELIHTYSLVHDDLPAMDDDDERRGRPTVHRAFDEATAILVGDALLTEAFHVLASSACPAKIQIASVLALSRAAGHRGMVGGQVGDISNSADVEGVHRRKTGALIRCAVELGALAAEAETAPLLSLLRYGECVGLAFQLADDVLDANEDAGDDGPPSFVRFYGVEETRRRGLAMAEEACDTVSALPHPEVLQEIARYTVQRTH